MKFIMRKQKKRKMVEGKETTFHVRGRPVEPTKIKRYMKRKRLSEDTLPLQPSSTAGDGHLPSQLSPSYPRDPATPEDISYSTPSGEDPPDPEVTSERLTDKDPAFSPNLSTSELTKLPWDVFSISRQRSASPSNYPAIIQSNSPSWETLAGQDLGPFPGLRTEPNFAWSTVTSKIPVPVLTPPGIPRPNDSLGIIPQDPREVIGLDNDWLNSVLLGNHTNTPPIG
jgi:hypothetical protein